ncbi:MAG: DUF433 domain-containing protein [Deltaproteobacteria bacterium]|nr:DUF433 domain-containing protein [Deltaproteobacteria bacterium]
MKPKGADRITSTRSRRQRPGQPLNWRARISIDSGIHHGDPCVKGTRVPVSVIVASVADGDSVTEILGAFPQLTAKDVTAALKFAAEAVNNADFIPSTSKSG